MTEELAIRYIPQRVQERGFQIYRLVFQDLNLEPQQEIRLAAFNELWILLEAESGIRISSDFGEYDYNNPKLSENIHEHADRIEILNQSSVPRKVKFIQVILK
ncbi:hypothetical protein GCM10009122_32970 [Fulvivirga kasyanovii]|jgi:hypothetical protein|uniref:Uncharacterized protein n=3 Tax=Cytophagales TaxID=768507 RepID=A0ABQ1M8Q7_9BACT|nr:hypothetical protein [Fulvivirga kasyanovii]MBT28466.1 hypothetical protein [Thalassovita sp.]WKN35986.1 hypothetical protein K4G66_26835 [Tunicatimonas sp. TK19036]GGC36386.1 hypothetical protein GCM10011506_22200 [Marivirga lumbricoides]HNP17009.1 hypothetical protein [Fulvivirga sp.]MTI27799.1 hypothetical protein [Fulvivirga kasyanovii]